MDPHVVPHSVPRPPPYAWAWLQRSRPVLQALAQRLTGQAPSPGFIEELRAAFDEDPFVQAVIIDTIAEVAFAGRVPRHRPAGVTWDRGLSWWAATLAGTTRREFEHGDSRGGEQPKLFPDAHTSASHPQRAPADAPRPPTSAARSDTSRSDTGGSDTAGPGAAQPPRPSVVVTLERRRMANALRSLLASNAGGDVPAEALRQLISDLESSE